ncbi:ABC transporter ATP-binding protein [Sphingomonas sp. ID0503]|uniref:ABC transporter ATP-binding protein n=1 Tax=Sphingomonas sp. ID0503 TaxID=3399691 RepID=UPI003AFA9FC4
MIELVNIEKSYRKKAGGRRQVLDGISATFERGHSYGLIGNNGAGKSTLLRIMGGAERPNYGVIRKDVQISWPLGFSGSFNGSLSGLENLRFVCRIYGADIPAVTEFVHDFAELGKSILEPVKTYSSGMRQRLAFALSMAIDFEVYLVDETLAVGDAAFQAKCHREFEARRAHSDVLLTSHSPQMLEEYCTRGAVLHEGRLTMFDSIKDALDYYRGMNA